MQSLFIIHSFHNGTKNSFGSYLIENCKALGLNVIFPDFPTGEDASYQSWCAIMDKYLSDGTLNANSIIVAHSLGAHFIPKYITLKRITINLYISCAGFLNKTYEKNDFDRAMEFYSNRVPNWGRYFTYEE